MKTESMTNAFTVMMHPTLVDELDADSARWMVLSPSTRCLVSFRCSMRVRPQSVSVSEPPGS